MGSEIGPTQIAGDCASHRGDAARFAKSGHD